MKLIVEFEVGPPAPESTGITPFEVQLFEAVMVQQANMLCGRWNEEPSSGEVKRYDGTVGATWRLEKTA